MSAYEQQLIAKYHQADLLSEAREARLARIAKDAKPHTERAIVTAVGGSLRGVLDSVTTVLHRRGAAGAARTAAAQPSVAGHVMLRSAHPR